MPVGETAIGPGELFITAPDGTQQKFATGGFVMGIDPAYAAEGTTVECKTIFSPPTVTTHEVVLPLVMNKKTLRKLGIYTGKMSRKRVIKLMMSKGIQRNDAEAIAFLWRVLGHPYRTLANVIG